MISLMDVLMEGMIVDLDISKPDLARGNIDSLLTSLERMIHLLDYPHASDYSEEFSFAKLDGLRPDSNMLPHIFKGHFSIPLNEFLTENFDPELLTEFEEECIDNLISIDGDQLGRAYRQLLTLYEMCDF